MVSVALCDYCVCVRLLPNQTILAVHPIYGLFMAWSCGPLCVYAPMHEVNVRGTTDTWITKARGKRAESGFDTIVCVHEPHQGCQLIVPTFLPHLLPPWMVNTTFRETKSFPEPPELPIFWSWKLNSRLARKRQWLPNPYGWWASAPIHRR